MNWKLKGKNGKIQGFKDLKIWWFKGFDGVYDGLRWFDGGLKLLDVVQGFEKLMIRWFENSRGLMGGMMVWDGLWLFEIVWNGLWWFEMVHL